MPKYLEFRDIPDCSAIAKRISRSLRKLGHGKGFGQERYIVDINGFTQLLFGITRHERSEEHTSELQSLMRISYAVFCLKKTKKKKRQIKITTPIHKQKQ